MTGKVYLIKKRWKINTFFCDIRRWEECKEYKSIDAAIEDAALGDTILVGAGVHKVKGFLSTYCE